MTEIANEQVDKELRRSRLMHIHVEPSRGWVPLKISELWKFKELLYFLTWRDIKVSYKQTVLGAAWAILQPVLTMVVFTWFFGNLAKVDSEGYPYPIFVYSGILPWTYFSQSLSQSSNSLVRSSNLISKIYFPRLILPVSSVLSPLVDFAFAFGVLIIMMFYFHITPTAGVLLLPVFLLLALVTALGVGLWLAGLNVEYRDVRYIIPFLVQLWFFATPVVYPSSLLDEPWRTLYGLNPMAGVVEGFRWALLGSDPPEAMIFVSALVSVGILISGAYYFRRLEKTFADHI